MICFVFLSTLLYWSVLHKTPSHNAILLSRQPTLQLPPSPFPMPRSDWSFQSLLPCCPCSLPRPSLLQIHVPSWLEMAECTVAPVAMEDSDCEAHSSSDDQDSAPPSPGHTRDHHHQAEQVPVTRPDMGQRNMPSTSQIFELLCLI